MPRLRTILKKLRTSEHGSIECFSYLKKHDMENYVKEEVVDPKGDVDKAKHKKDLVKSKRIISFSIGSHRHHPCILPRICSIQ